MSIIQKDNPATDFIAEDVLGNKLRLSDYRGKKVLLVFFRFATCPFCTMRFVQLHQEIKNLKAANIQVIGVFESSQQNILDYIGRRGLAFPIIADPSARLYAQYGIKKSFMGLMLGMFRLPTLIRAMMDRQFKMGLPDSPVTRIPADFLIDEDMIVQNAYYGSDIGDHISFKEIEKFARSPADKSSGIEVQAGV